MRAVLCLTMGVYTKYCAPLNQLGILTFKEGFDQGILNKVEYTFLERQLGEYVPLESDFKDYQDKAMKNMLMVAYS